MPLCYWATQTTAATALLENGTSGSTFRTYLTPISAAVRIQQAYHRYSAKRARAAVRIQHAYRNYSVQYYRYIMPPLQGPYTAIHGSKFWTDEYVTGLNDVCRTTLAQMYRTWADLPFIELLAYLAYLYAHPNRADRADWPKLPSIFAAEYKREYYAQRVVDDNISAELIRRRMAKRQLNAGRPVS